MCFPVSNTSQSSRGIRGRASSRHRVSWKECGKQWQKEVWGNMLIWVQRGSLNGPEGPFSVARRGSQEDGSPSPRPAGIWVKGEKQHPRKVRLQAEEVGGRVYRRAQGWEAIHVEPSDPRGLWGGPQETPQHGPGSQLWSVGVCMSEFSRETEHVWVCMETYLKELTL